ncbi:MAG: M20/M25/M40 family metallo-hydrolase [Desulfosudis oleivorans]|nr:M20/M25/M40 family metallo-hydrolase [Desulfosudis oleivorans]
MVKPAEKALYFGTPSFTAGTKGLERGTGRHPEIRSVLDPGPQRHRRRTSKRSAPPSEAAIAEVRANPAAFKGAWVLIPGQSTGFARDGRRGTPEYADAQLIPPLTAALVEAGARGTIQLSKTDPFPMLDGFAESWDKLPVLPDIKLAEGQYNEIKGLVEKGEPVELEFDIRNWFKMGPVKYHSVVATLRGTEFPDEYVVLGGHFDCFSGATGGVDDGSGFAPAMEAIRLIQAAGGQPKRSVVVILFAAEEIGLVGSQAWLKNRPGIAPKIVDDGQPGRQPERHHRGDGARDLVWPTSGGSRPRSRPSIPKWPFKLERGVPRANATSPGGSDSHVLRDAGRSRLCASRRSRITITATPGTPSTTSTASSCPTRSTRSTPRWSRPSSPTASPTSTSRSPGRASIFPTGSTPTSPSGPATTPAHIMTTLDFVNAPLQTANFVRIVEGKGGQRGPGGGPGAACGPAGRGRRSRPSAGSTCATASWPGSSSPTSRSPWPWPPCRLAANPAIKHDAAGVLGVSGPNAFHLTLRKRAGLDKTATAIGRTIAGLDLLKTLKKGDPIRSVRIVRVGQAARDFKTDDEAFKKLLEK